MFHDTPAVSNDNNMFTTKITPSPNKNMLTTQKTLFIKYELMSKQNKKSLPWAWMASELWNNKEKVINKRFQQIQIVSWSSVY